LFGGFNKTRTNWPIIAAVVFGLLVSAIAATRLMCYTSTHVAMENVSVMAHDVSPYTVLQVSDITIQQEVKGSRQPGTISDPSEAIGKMTTSAIFKSEQIETKRLADAKIAQGKQIVSVNIDLARSVGGWLQPGDIVDAWWIPSEGNIQTPGIGWVQVATNAVVLDLKDSTGKSLFTGGGTIQQALVNTVSTAAGSPAIVVLAVNAGDVGRVVGGAIPKSESIVLVKKFSQEPEQAQQVTPQTENQNQNTQQPGQPQQQPGGGQVVQ
jgi:Flp pilus assembly protein CpaB